ncbi:kinase-like domain-containing protein [Rhizophagus clarus]|uniref:Kinase-like domain-containing protein n=1 Tax=Rhizophagus clarus TaxID=94130 RepID=A0A8H3MC15_9GLOM|nr:kinase-like domain-containing protein [Rhizophagus clarus]
MVIELKKGSLRQHLNNNFNLLNWKDKLYILQAILYGLKNIHNNGLIHHDFHCGNLLSDYLKSAYITDLRLCQPANVEFSQINNKKIYGVLAYVAPEVLRGKVYTQASDIYDFGIIAHKICTGLPPYYDMAHYEFLAIRICQGLRPMTNYKIPPLILDIINQCLDADPSKRPKAGVLQKLFYSLYHYNNEDPILEQIQETDEINKKLCSSATSLPSSSNEPSNDNDLLEIGYSGFYKN